jgi:hypothetical protein
MSTDSAREYAEGIAEGLREDTLDDPYEYLDSVLDYELTYTSQKELKSVRLLVSFGGPNAWVIFDGTSATVQASWYSDMVEVYVPEAPLSDPIFEYFEQNYSLA